MVKGSAGVSEVSFFINGESYTVNPANEKFDLSTPLVDFIRDTANLKGTKYMCREGGCGACVVQVKSKDPVSGQEITKAVNSCLTPVLSCDGWDISTVESLGNKKVGYHKIQERLAKFNGTQCGYCSPGMVMNMYSLLNSKDKVTVQDISDSLDGNICRCTGYRPILDAFKTFAVDAPEDIKQKLRDIEDCAGCPKSGGCCKEAGNACGAGKCSSEPKDINIKLASGEEWVQPLELGPALQILHKFSMEGKKYRVVAGNTGSGVFKHDGPYDTFLDINKIAELKKSTITEAGVVLGAGVTLTNAIQLLQEASKLPGYEYASDVAKHWERVANVPVRNNGTIAGNLMMKHAHQEFPSDVFLMLETVGAEVNIAEGSHGLKSILPGSSVNARRHSLLEFLNMDMKGKLIVSVHLPQWKDYRFRSFKITRRYQNAHAYVNAGFLIKVDATQNFKVVEKPRILFGGISPKFTHATATEAFLNGKSLGDAQTLKGAMEVLDKEIQPDFVPPDASPAYRKQLAKSLLYKTILAIIDNGVNERLQSGGVDIKREISKGKQTYDVEKGDSVLYKNVTKVEAGVQASGEAEYINDVPPRPDELYGAFVLSTVACADIVSVDTSEALKTPGVVAYVGEKDIPGTNNYMSYNFFPIPVNEEIFAKGKVNHADQSIGVVLAKTQALANEGARKVKVTYANQRKPLLDIRDSLKKVEAEGTLANHFLPIVAKSKTPAPEGGSKHTIKGDFGIGSQYHFHMETQSVICIPKEDGMDVLSATQWMDHGQIVVAEALGVPTNNINVEVRRLGGSFGGKINRATHLAAACAIAANAVNKPVRLVLDLETNMRMMGKRCPYLSRYEVGFDDTGKIDNLNVEIFCDPGYSATEADTFIAANHVQSVYAANGWEIKPGFLLTDTPSNTSCRAPGTTQGAATIEYIMEHIAHSLGKNPLEVRVANLMKQGDSIVTSGKELEGENLVVRMLEELKVSGDYENRKKAVDSFNKENRWKKRGLSLVPLRYELDYFNVVKFPVSVVINHRDGFVAVTHGGIEMGQGLNTKVAQTVADTLKIPMDQIKIRPSNTFIGGNAMVTGGSFGSEICAAAAKEACKILLDRMAPVKEKLEDKSWKSVVTASYDANLDLFASYMYGPNDKYKDYYIWAIILNEMEVDILTGEYKVTRVDLIEDAGKSLSPGVDIGQIEGAYLMGQGLWTSEKLVYDKESGQLLTNNTWEYKPPESKDIPEDFRVTLLSNAPNPNGIMRSKATGEPPLVTSVAVFFALKQAIDSARQDVGVNEWCPIDGPITPEDVVHHSLTSADQFTF